MCFFGFRDKAGTPTAFAQFQRAMSTICETVHIGATAVACAVGRSVSDRNGISPARLWDLMQLQNSSLRHCTSVLVSNR
jgi:hypothetical protein